MEIIKLISLTAMVSSSILYLVTYYMNHGKVRSISHTALVIKNPIYFTIYVWFISLTGIPFVYDSWICIIGLLMVAFTGAFPYIDKENVKLWHYICIFGGIPVFFTGLWIDYSIWIPFAVVASLAALSYKNLYRLEVLIIIVTVLTYMRLG